MNYNRETITVSEFFYQFFLPHIEHLSPETRQRTEKDFALHIRPFIGESKLIFVSPEEINQIIREFENKQVSEYTVYGLYRLLQRIYKLANSMGILEYEDIPCRMRYSANNHGKMAIPRPKLSPKCIMSP